LQLFANRPFCERCRRDTRKTTALQINGQPLYDSSSDYVTIADRTTSYLLN